MKQKLIFTVGLARSGKSTICEDIFADMHNTVIVNGDSIRLALHGERYRSLCEDYVSAIKHTMIRALHIHKRYNVIVDGTHTTAHSIQKLLEINRNAKPIFIPTSPNICIQRALNSRQPDLVPVIKRQYQNLLQLMRVPEIPYHDEQHCHHLINLAVDKLRPPSPSPSPNPTSST